MMELRVYLFLLFGTMVVFYLLGYEAPILYVLAQSEEGGWDIIGEMLNIFTDERFLAAIGFSTVVAFLASGNYSVTFIVPIALLLIIANIFILPTSYILDAQLPEELKIL
ncbi:TPA: hypothetical protein EYP13_04650, partial [Candidatus Micrarchaeota archaeon]|nr:hypothetical protein [Candidatus Micrarchaeota archaeon]